jgi:hypothetical protein
VTSASIIVETEHGAWAWTGVRIAAAADLTDVREFADLPEAERLSKAVREQVSFLSGHLGRPEPIELRWIWDPESGRLEAFLLSRAHGRDREEAVTAALAVAAALATAPRQVFIEPLSEREIEHALAPFAIAGSGAVEVRKRVLIADPQRPDAGVRYYFGVQPFTGTARSWEPLLRALSSHPHPVAISVGLSPMAVPGSLIRAVAAAASHYRRLASDGEYQQGHLYGSKVKLTPDAFAVEADKIYADAARRYQGGAFQIRIACFSPVPLGDGIPGVLGTTISSTERGEGENYLSTDALGVSFSLERPQDQPQLDDFVYNVESLSFREWGGHPIWADRFPPPPALRPLTWIVDAEEATAAFRLPVAAHGTLPGFAVRSLSPAVVADYEPNGAHLVLGRQNLGDRDGGALAIALDDLTSHALFVGTTGSGKTNSSLAFLYQLWRDHGVPFTVIEPVNADRDDYRWLATLPEFDDLLILTVGDEKVAPFRLNPFEVPSGVRISTHIANLRACFDAAFGLWDPLPAIYARALRETYARAGFDVTAHAVANEKWPVLDDFVTAITDVTADLDYAGEVRSNILAASRLRAESLLEGPCGPTLAAARSFPIAELLARPVVVELAAIGDDAKEQALVMALLLNVMTEHYKAHRTSSDLAHVTVIEEAHRLLGRPTPGGDVKQGDAQVRAAEAFANTLAENRKYGEGLVIVEQSPSKLIPDAYKNTNLKVMHRLLSGEDRILIGDTMRFSDDQRRYAGALPKMSAFTYHSRLDRPALIAVPDVRAEDAVARQVPQAPLVSNAEIARRHTGWAETTPVVAEALVPQAPCGVCPVHCSLAYAAERAAADGAGEYKDIMKLWQSTSDPVDRERWRKLFDLLDRVGSSHRPARVVPGEPHWRTAIFIALYGGMFPDGNPSRWRVSIGKRTAEHPVSGGRSR